MKRLLNTLYVISDDTYLKLDGENVVCSTKEKKFRVPFITIEDIVLFNYSGCSPALMGKCVECGIPISFITPFGKFQARIIGETKGNVNLRKSQVYKFDDNQIQLAQNTVASKLHNTISVIKRSLHDNKELDRQGKLTEAINVLKLGIDNVYSENDLTNILGIEGVCAKKYFYIFDDLILKQKDQFRLLNRTKRPPLDKVNAVLSFLYTILTSNYASALESVGLDSYIGFYHALRSGRTSLACDLVEETRCVVDRMVLTMINLKILSEKDFNKQISGATFLNDEGKKKVLAKWQEKKRSKIKHPYLNQEIQFGLLPYVQSNLLAKYIRGEINEYPCFLIK